MTFLFFHQRSLYQCHIQPSWNSFVLDWENQLWTTYHFQKVKRATMFLSNSLQEQKLCRVLILHRIQKDVFDRDMRMQHTIVHMINPEIQYCYVYSHRSEMVHFCIRSFLYRHEQSSLIGIHRFETCHCSWNISLNSVKQSPDETVLYPSIWAED